MEIKEKIKLYAIENDGSFNRYEFDKKQEVADKIVKLFKDIFGIYWNFYEEYQTKKGKWNTRKTNIEKIKDSHESLRDGGSRIDVFYGDKSMFITIICSQENRLKFNEELFKISIMPKPSKIKK